RHHHHLLRQGRGAPHRAGARVRISAKGEYAIKAMLDLALSDGGGLRPIQDIATRQDIPQRYLEQVLLGLTRAGLLVSKRGCAGGYRLAPGRGAGGGGGGGRGGGG